MMKWSLLAVGAGVALLVAAWIVGRDSATPLKTYRTAGLSFEYPADWHVLSPSARSLRSEVLAYASTDRLEDPCHLSFDRVTCEWPLTRLSRSGALVTMSRRPATRRNFARLPGVPARIDGRRARIQIQRPGMCNAVGGDFTMVALIEREETNHYLVVSCLRDSGDSGERDARRLLSSIHFDQEA